MLLYIIKYYRQKSMKNHTVPAGADLTGTSEGNVKYSKGFNWAKACAKALEKQKYRAIHLARTNPDYQRKYPAELRDNPEGKILLCCHKEAEKRLIEEHEKILKLSIVPTVDRPTRLNRTG